MQQNEREKSNHRDIPHREWEENKVIEECDEVCRPVMVFESTRFDFVGSCGKPISSSIQHATLTLTITSRHSRSSVESFIDDKSWYTSRWCKVVDGTFFLFDLC